MFATTNVPLRAVLVTLLLGFWVVGFYVRAWTGRAGGSYRERQARGCLGGAVILGGLVLLTIVGLVLPMIHTHPPN
jgi:hypothetical protein